MIYYQPNGWRACCLLILVSLWSCQPTQEPAPHLLAAASKVTLTPPLELGYTLGGYGARMSKPAEAIHDDIWAKALVIRDQGKQFAIVTMDILGLPPNVKSRLIRRLDDEAWNAENIMLLPSHAHSSLEMLALNEHNIFDIPAIGIFQPALLDFVVDRLAQLIIQTDQALAPVTTGTSSKEIADLNRNRRGSTPVDRELTVTRIDQMDGTPLAILVNWTAHPTIMDEHDMWVSGGWPGYLQRELEAWIGHGVVAMYYNGAEGDQSVVAGAGGSHYEKAEIYGRRLALEVMPLYEDIQVEGEVTFDYSMRSVALPPKRPHPDFMRTGGQEYMLNEDNIDALLNQVLPDSTYIGVVRLGSLMIVGAPGEMIAQLGLQVKDALRTEHVRHPVVGGLANEWISYMLTPAEYAKGGYEASVSFFGEGLGDLIAQEMIVAARELP